MRRRCSHKADQNRTNNGLKDVGVATSRTRLSTKLFEIGLPILLLQLLITELLRLLGSECIGNIALPWSQCIGNVGRLRLV